MQTPKILVFDLETCGVSFKANSGFLLCAGIKELGKPVQLLVRDNIQPDPLNDKKLCKEVASLLSSADMWVTHNGKWFDVKYLNSRLLKWGLPPLPSIPHFDTCETGFKKLAIKNSLKEMGKYLGCKTSKYEVSMDEWVRAYAGDKKAMSEIVKHCKQDVELTEQVYLRLRPFGHNPPNLSLIYGDDRNCPHCGAKDSLKKNGYKLAIVGKAQRYQCRKCGGYARDAYKQTEVKRRP